jgi:type IV pilus assembly protein PilM
MFGFKPKSYLGVDLGAGGVKLVELRLEKKRPVLFTYGLTSGDNDVHQVFVDQAEQAAMAAALPTQSMQQIALNTDLVKDTEKIKRYASLIKAVCKAAKTTSKIAVVSLPVSAVFHTIVTLPMLKKADSEAMLKAEMTKLLPYPLAETALDYEMIPQQEHEKVQRIVVNAVPKNLVLFYSKIFQQAGLTLSALEPESVALTRSLVGHDTALSMIVDIGAERTNFFIIDEARTITHHSIELGGKRINTLLQNIIGVDADKIEQIKYDVFQRLLAEPEESMLTKEEFLDIFTEVIDPIAKEIQYSFDLYLRQSSNQSKSPEKIILTGGGAYLPFLPAYLAEKFKLKVYLGDPWRRVVYQDGLKPVLHTLGPRMSVAIGLALRNML